MTEPSPEELARQLQQAENILRSAIEMRMAQRYYYRTRREDALTNAKERERRFEVESEQYCKTWGLFQTKLPL